jgi:hypothetical protein
MDMDEKAERYEQLTAYLDGELSDDERREVEALLDQDAEARKLLAQLRETSGLVAALPRAMASSELTASIMGRLERRELLAELEPPEKPRPRVRSLEWVRPIGVAAGLAIVCTASWLVYKQTNPAASKSAPADLTIAQGVAPSSVESIQLAKRDGDDAVGAAARRMIMNEESAAAGRGGQRGHTEATDERIAAAPPPAAGKAGPKLLDAVAAKPAEPSDAEAYRLTEQTAGRPLALNADKRLDDSLAANTLDAGGVLKAGMEEFSNRIVLQTDQYTTQEIMARVRSFMLRNEVPDLRTMPADQPISATQAFYAMKVEEEDEHAGAKEEEEWRAVRVVANLQVGEAARLVEAMQRVTRRRENAQWTANSQPLSGKESADELAGLFLASTDHKQLDELESRREVLRDVGGRAAGGGAFAKGESTPAQEAQLGKARRTTAEPATQPKADESRFVTVAILLTPPAAPPPTDSEAVGKVAPASSPVTTQPAETSSEGADDGRE